MTSHRTHFCIVKKVQTRPRTSRNNNPIGHTYTSLTSDHDLHDGAKELTSPQSLVGRYQSSCMFLSRKAINGVAEWLIRF
jgi:hypothetical protein